MSEEYAISLEHIYKSFGGVTVLDDVNFHLERGIVHALVGSNGAGKSTLMKILTGVYSCDSGTIRVNGQTVKIKDVTDAQKNGIKMIFQELSLSPTLTVMENIFLSNEIKKGIVLDKKAMTKKTQELLDELDIVANADDKIQDLDVGVCQLIEIVKALSVNSRILIMDEPTASLSDKETKVLFKIINSLKEKGVSIVYISHRMKEIFEVADKITVLKDGKIVADMSKEEYTMNSLIDCMIGANVEKKMEYKKRSIPLGDEVMLSVENLTVPEKVHGVSFVVKKGEVVGLAGLMGSGRTETLETLFGIQKHGKAKITLDGEKIRIKNVHNAIEKGIVLIPEDRRRQGLVLMHTVKDNLCLPNLKRVQKGLVIKKEKVKKLTDESIKSLDIKTDGVDVGMLSLSGGNQQKVVIAKWLQTQPKLLLMDEPTAGVDIAAKGEIIDIIRKFVAEQKSVIIVSSELSELMAVCDRIIIYSDGHITKEYQREQIENEEMLEYAIQH
jgi:ribose transport system ATP-binding protein